MSHAQPNPWPEGGLEAVARCPVCASPNQQLIYAGLTDRVFFCAGGTWSIYGCQRCASAYLNPRPTLDAVALAYRSYFTHASPLEAKAGPYLRRLQRALGNGYRNARFGTQYRPAIRLGSWMVPCLPSKKRQIDAEARNLHPPKLGGRLLDVGCGNGDFVRLASMIGWNAEGIDVDGVAVANAASQGLRVRQGRIDVYDGESAIFDAITLSHVIEHVHDPNAVLLACHRLLKPDGVLWLETPNLNSLGHKLYKNAWLHLDPPRHLVIFNVESLHGALRGAGFKRLETQPYAAKCVHTFNASEAIAAGRDPLSQSTLTLGGHLRAWRADQAAQREPGIREVITIKAWK